MMFSFIDMQVHHLLVYITTWMVVLGIFHTVNIFLPLVSCINYQAWNISDSFVKWVCR